MSDPKPPHITRDACALYFAARSVVLTALCCSFSALLLILFHLYLGSDWDTTVGPALFAAQIHLFALPIVLLFGLQMGENLWRNYYLPDKPRYFRRFLYWTRLVCAGVGVAMLVLFRGIPPEPLILLAVFAWLVMELYFERARRAEFLQTAPGMRTLCAIAFLSLLLQGWFISTTTRHILEEAFVAQQVIVIGCLCIYEANEAVNIMWKWEQQGRLPPEGNHRFQIQLSTILLIVCGLGLWGALLKWTFF